MEFLPAKFGENLHPSDNASEDQSISDLTRVPFSSTGDTINRSNLTTAVIMSHSSQSYTPPEFEIGGIEYRPRPFHSRRVEINPVVAFATSDDKAPGITRHVLHHPRSHHPQEAFLLLVWIDGACHDSGGFFQAEASWAVSFGRGSPFNSCGLLPRYMRPTCCRADIESLVRALDTVENIFFEHDMTEPRTRTYIRQRCVGVMFFSDSEYLCKAVTVWMKHWVLNDGMGENGPVAYFELLRDLHERLLALERTWGGIHVSMVHIPKDLNTDADDLAKRALYAGFSM